MSEENGADVALKVAGQEMNIRNVKSLNTVATLACLLGVCILLVWFFEHKVDAKAQSVSEAVERREDRKEMVSALKEMAAQERERTIQQKITNCLIERSGAPRTVNDCERQAR